MIPQQNSNNDNYYIYSLYKKRQFFGTLMNFSSAKEMGGRTNISQTGVSKNQNG